MICIVCGRKMSNETRYCKECGAFQPELDMAEEKSRKKNKKSLFRLF